MDIRHQNIKDVFFETCKKQNMQIAKSGPLLTDDTTVYFASATITPLKEILVNGRIPNNNLYLHQRCFRLQALENPFYSGAEIQYPGYFNMLGTLVHPKNIDAFQDTMVKIIEDQNISRNNVKIAASSKDDILVTTLRDYYKVEYDTRDEKHYNWTYGMGDNITGRGMTFLLKLDTGAYKRIGQYIAIYDKKKLIAAEYGVGIEVLLARKENYKNEYEAFSIASILAKNGMDANFANVHVLSSVGAAYSTGITMDKNPSRGYKKLLGKMLLNLALLKARDNLSEEQILTILNDFLTVEFGNTNNFVNLINDFKLKESELHKQIQQAEVFIKNQKHLGKTDEFINKRMSELYPMYNNYCDTILKSR